MWRGNDENLADPREHKHRKCIVDQRLVVYRQQLFRDGNRRGVKTRAATAGKYDSLHIDVPAVWSMSRSRQVSSEVCHLGRLIPKIRLSFEQSRRECAGRFARVGYSLLAIARTRHA